MQFTTILFTLATLSATTMAVPLPITLDSAGKYNSHESQNPHTDLSFLQPAAAATTTATATSTRSAPWALPSGGTSCIHCDPAFLRAADDEDPETGALYRRACARACF